MATDYLGYGYGSCYGYGPCYGYGSSPRRLGPRSLKDKVALRTKVVVQLAATAAYYHYQYDRRVAATGMRAGYVCLRDAVVTNGIIGTTRQRTGNTGTTSSNLIWAQTIWMRLNLLANFTTFGVVSGYSELISWYQLMTNWWQMVPQALAPQILPKICHVGVLAPQILSKICHVGVPETTLDAKVPEFGSQNDLLGAIVVPNCCQLVPQANFGAMSGYSDLVSWSQLMTNWWQMVPQALAPQILHKICHVGYDFGYGSCYGYGSYYGYGSCSVYMATDQLCDNSYIQKVMVNDMASGQGHYNFNSGAGVVVVREPTCKCKYDPLMNMATCIVSLRNSLLMPTYMATDYFGDGYGSCYLYGSCYGYRSC